MSARAAKWLPRALVLAVVLAGVAWVVANRDLLDPAALDAWLSGFGIAAPVVFVVAYAAGTVFFLPATPFALAGGALFGPLWGALLNLFGATVGATLGLLVARYLAQAWVARRAGGRLKRLMEGVDAEGWRAVAFVRLVPLFPFSLTSYALGLTRIRLAPYVVTTLICIAPAAFAFTWLGHAGREALSGDATAIRYGVLALGLLVALAFVPRFIKRFRRAPTAWIEAEALHRRREADAPVSVLDVRGPDEFDGPLGHIPGALNVPLGELAARLDDVRRAPNAGVVIVCLTDKRSATAAQLLRGEGFADVKVLRGGMKRWNELAFETSASAP